MSDEIRVLLTNYYNLLYSVLENCDLKDKDKKLLMHDYNLIYYLLKK